MSIFIEIGTEGRVIVRVLFSAEEDLATVVQVATGRVHAGQEEENAHVELVPADQQGVLNVSLEDKVSPFLRVSLQNFVKLGHTDIVDMATGSTVIIFRFIYPHRLLVFAHV